MSRQPSESWQQWQQWQAATSGDSASFVSVDDDAKSFMTMREIDPSPIDSPAESESPVLIDGDDLEKSDATVRDEKPALTRSGTFGALGLSGSGNHGAIYYLSRIQRYSSYTFSIYSLMHITNTSLLPLLTTSIPEADKYLLLTRPYYQSFPMEPLLIVIPLLAHISSGLAIRVIRRNQNARRYGAHSLSPAARISSKQRIWPAVSWNSVSGYVLAPLVFGHAFVNRILPLWVDGGSSGVGLGFVAHGFAKHPVVANVGYAALVATFSGHVVWGVAKYQNWVPIGTGEMGANGRIGKRRWWIINAVSVAVAGLWLAGGLGIVGRGGAGTGWIAQLWDDIYARVPVFGGSL